MKTSTGLIIISIVIGLIVLMLVIPARAWDRADDPAAQAAPEAEEESPADERGLGEKILDFAESLGGEEERPASASAQQIHEQLVAISPGAGWQLPPAAAIDSADWQTVEVGLATMRVPADWTVQNRIGKPGDEDQTIGLSPPSMDLYIELRMIRNADNNYMQTAAQHAVSDYSSSPDRLAKDVIFGYQPLQVGGAAGHVEVMNQFGKPVDDEGNPTFRLVHWRGRWEQDTLIHRAQFDATMAQDHYEQAAPLVRAILDTVRVRESEMLVE